MPERYFFQPAPPSSIFFSSLKLSYNCFFPVLSFVFNCTQIFRRATKLPPTVAFHIHIQYVPRRVLITSSVLRYLRSVWNHSIRLVDNYSRVYTTSPGHRIFAEGGQNMTLEQACCDWSSLFPRSCMFSKYLKHGQLSCQYSAMPQLIYAREKYSRAISFYMSTMRRVLQFHHLRQMFYG